MTTTASTEALIANLDKVANEVRYLAGPGRVSSARVDRWQARDILMHFIYFHDATAWGIQSAALGGRRGRARGLRHREREACRRLHEHESFDGLLDPAPTGACAAARRGAPRARSRTSRACSARRARSADRAPAPRAPRPPLGRAREPHKPPPEPGRAAGGGRDGDDREQGQGAPGGRPALPRHGARQARTVDIGRVLAACGFDFAFIDMEHNTMGIDTAAQIAVACHDAGVTPLVRVPGLRALPGHAAPGCRRDGHRVPARGSAPSRRDSSSTTASTRRWAIARSAAPWRSSASAPIRVRSRPRSSTRRRCS